MGSSAAAQGNQISSILRIGKSGTVLSLGPQVAMTTHSRCGTAIPRRVLVPPEPYSATNNVASTRLPLRLLAAKRLTDFEH